MEAVFVSNLAVDSQTCRAFTSLAGHLDSLEARQILGPFVDSLNGGLT